MSAALDWSRGRLACRCEVSASPTEGPEAVKATDLDRRSVAAGGTGALLRPSLSLAAVEEEVAVAVAAGRRSARAPLLAWAKGSR